jgi:nucleoside-diphosphate-sugar epimerase
MKISQRKKVLITGGSGYIGSVLANTLVKKKIPLRVIDIAPFPSKFPNGQAEFILADIRDIPDSILSDISAIIHLAGKSNEILADQNAAETKAVNTDATFTLAKRAKRAEVRRFIFASSSSIYDLGIDKETGPKREIEKVSPTGMYSLSKYVAEKKLLLLPTNDFCVVILRKATVCGYSPNMRFDLVVNAMVKSVLEKGYIKVFCKGRQWRPLISVTDVAEAYYQALVAPLKKVNGQIFNIGFNNFKVIDIALLVQKTLQKHFAMQPTIIFEQNNRSDRSYRITTKKAKDVLDFRACETIENAIVNLVKNLRQNGF